MRGGNADVTFRLLLEVERGIADLIGEGDGGTGVAWLSLVSGVNSTRFTPFTRPTPIGVVGTDGRPFSRFGWLALVAKSDVVDGFFVFFVLKLGCRRMDLTRSNLLGVRNVTLLGAVMEPAMLFIVAAFGNPRGVLFRFGFEDDFDKVGI